jgi:hypothetical protein
MARKGNRKGTPNCGENGHSRNATPIELVKSRRPKGSGKNLVEAFLYELDRSWQEDGRELLKRLRAERPKFYFKALIQLTLVLHDRLPKTPEFDRRRHRADVLQRLRQT